MNISEIKEKELQDIQRSYIKDIIDFFIIKYFGMYKDWKTWYENVVNLDLKGEKNINLIYLESFLETRIRSILLDRNLISDFKVDINIRELKELRDNKIDSIVNNLDFEKDSITICIRYENNEFKDFKYYLI